MNDQPTSKTIKYFGKSIEIPFLEKDTEIPCWR